MVSKKIAHDGTARMVQAGSIPATPLKWKGNNMSTPRTNHVELFGIKLYKESYFYGRGISKNTIRQWIDSGIFTPYIITGKVQKTRYFREEDFLQALENAHYALVEEHEEHKETVEKMAKTTVGSAFNGGKEYKELAEKLSKCDIEMKPEYMPMPSIKNYVSH